MERYIADSTTSSCCASPQFFYNSFMPFPILTSKLYIPRSDAIIIRPHLFERLNDGLDRKLILVAPPAGFGKTSLIRA